MPLLLKSVSPLYDIQAGPVEVNDLSIFLSVVDATFALLDHRVSVVRTLRKPLCSIGVRLETDLFDPYELLGPPHQPAAVQSPSLLEDLQSSVEAA